MKLIRCGILASALPAILFLSGCSNQPEQSPEPLAAAPAQQPAPPTKKEFVFNGTIVKMDTGSNTVMVNNENVPGWMNSMVMTYHVDKPEILKSLKPGDKITARVYEGNFQTLYNVQPASSPQ